MELGLSTATEPGTPLVRLTTRAVNDAYARRIRQQLSLVMDGSSVAVAASQRIAEARRLLLSEVTGATCEEDLRTTSSEAGEVIPTSLPDPKKNSKKSGATLNGDPTLQIHWLKDLYPTLFTGPIELLNDTQFAELAPQMAADPANTLQSFYLLDHEVRTRFPQDPNTSLLGSFQRQAAVSLGQFLRLQRLSQPQLVHSFEYALMAKAFELSSDTERLAKLLHAIGALDLTPGKLHLMLVPMLEDPRIEVRKLTAGILMDAATHYGLPPNLEDALLRSRNADALEILVSSRKPLNASSYQLILAELDRVKDEQVLKSITRILLGNPEWREATLTSLQTVRDNPHSDALNRLYASTELIDTGADVKESEDYIIESLTKASGSELFQLNTWCFSSSSCTNRVRQAIQSARVPQKYHDGSYSQSSVSKYHRS